MSNLDSAWQRTKGINFLREEKQISHPVRRMMLDNAVGGTVVDFGCASCIDYPMWRDAGYDYTGIDFTDKFLEYARRLYPRIKLIHSDVANVNLPDESFHTGYCKDLLEHQPPGKYVSVLEEMWRLTGCVMMVAFYISPKDKPTMYNLVKGIHYKNRYNKQEMVDAINKLKPWSLNIVENIGYNNSALYVVKKDG